jgi:hypothetical protein
MPDQLRFDPVQPHLPPEVLHGMGKLKRLLADTMLDNVVLEDLLGKN